MRRLISSTLSRALLALFATVSLAGCLQDNAVLEVVVYLPASTASYDTVVFRAQSVDPDQTQAELESDELNDAWAGALALSALPDSASADPIQLSIVADDGDFGKDVLIRAAFCDEDCDRVGTARPEQRLLVRRPLYAAERTDVTWTIASIPSAGDENFTEITRCEVGGCSERISTTFFCEVPGDSSSAHLCEL